LLKILKRQNLIRTKYNTPPASKQDPSLSAIRPMDYPNFDWVRFTRTISFALAFL
jgi:hypothetical protein